MKLRGYYVTFLAVGGFLLFWGLTTIPGDAGTNLEKIFPAAGGALISHIDDDDLCLPPLMGNRYMEIKVPYSYCMCVDEWASKQSELASEGVSFDDYKAMCADVSFTKVLMENCIGINKIIGKHSSQTLACQCFSNEVKHTMVKLTDTDGVGEYISKYRAEGYFDDLRYYSRLRLVSIGQRVNNYSRVPVYPLYEKAITQCMK